MEDKEKYNIYCFKVSGKIHQVGFVKESIPIEIVTEALFETGKKGFDSYIESCEFIGKAETVDVNFLHTMRLAYKPILVILNY